MADNKKTQPAAQTQPEKKAAKTENKDKKVPFGTKVKNFFGRIGKYFKDTKSELKKVVWPSRTPRTTPSRSSSWWPSRRPC